MKKFYGIILKRMPNWIKKSKILKKIINYYIYW